MTSRIKMVDGDDDNQKFGQRPLAAKGPLSGTEERGQQVLPTSVPGQDTSKLILPEMPLPSGLPADDD